MFRSDPDVNALYCAIRESMIISSHKPIENGANLNAQTKQGHTAMHEAAQYNNLDVINVLLYYGADPNVLNKNNRTPLLKALLCGNINISKILINYYDGYLKKVLYFAIRCDVNLACTLIEKMEADVNYVWSPNQNVLESTLRVKNVTFDLFKLIWERFDYRIILNGKKPFLPTFITGCSFTTNHWIRCLSLILNSQVGFELARECDNSPGFFSNLLVSFYQRKVNLPNRLHIIHIALTLSIPLHLDELLIAYNLFGFNEELEILIYFVTSEQFNWANYFDIRACLLSMILGNKDEFDGGIKDMNLIKSDYSWLGYFNRGYYEKLFGGWRTVTYNIQFRERLQLLPEFPTLLELSRTAARKFIRQAFNVRKPYQFHDAVRRLNLPQYIENIIRFKVPIYFCE